MGTEVTAQEIKEIRQYYGLSQKAFAQILGIGEASIVRYEQGKVPTRAISNLIRAAKNPSFMKECYERCNEVVANTQQVEAIIYAEVEMSKEGIPANINEIYELTLGQEILNEKAAQVFADAMHLHIAAKEEGSEVKELISQDLMKEIWSAKVSILDCQTQLDLSRVKGRIECLETFVGKLENVKAA